MNQMILVGPIGHKVKSKRENAWYDGEVMEHKGMLLMARANRGPVGWIGELTILLSREDPSLLYGYIPVYRFHMDPHTAVSEALLEGIRRVERGEVIAF